MALQPRTLAAELPKEGTYDATACMSGVSNNVGVPDGDRAGSWESFRTSFNMAGGIITRSNVSGTGNYEGMVASGDFKALGPFPDNLKPGNFQSCNRQTGTYKLK